MLGGSEASDRVRSGQVYSREPCWYFTKRYCGISSNIPSRGLRMYNNIVRLVTIQGMEYGTRIGHRCISGVLCKTTVALCAFPSDRFANNKTFTLKILGLPFKKRFYLPLCSPSWPGAPPASVPLLTLLKQANCTFVPSLSLLRLTLRLPNSSCNRTLAALSVFWSRTW